MRTITRTIAVLAVPLIAMSITSCGSSGGPKDIDDLAKMIEKAGYACQAPYNDPDYPGETEMRCGEDVGVVWYDTAEAEVASYSNAESIYKDLGLPYLTLRGETWNVLGPESDLSKIAGSMDVEVNVGGAK